MTRFSNNRTTAHRSGAPDRSIFGILVPRHYAKQQRNGGTNRSNSEVLIGSWARNVDDQWRSNLPRKSRGSIMARNGEQGGMHEIVKREISTRSDNIGKREEFLSPHESRRSRDGRSRSRKHSICNRHVLKIMISGAELELELTFARNHHLSENIESHMDMDMDMDMDNTD
jgi:hypothetical protein